MRAYWKHLFMLISYQGSTIIETQSLFLKMELYFSSNFQEGVQSRYKKNGSKQLETVVLRSTLNFPRKKFVQN